MNFFLKLSNFLLQLHNFACGQLFVVVDLVPQVDRFHVGLLGVVVHFEFKFGGFQMGRIGGFGDLGIHRGRVSDQEGVVSGGSLDHELANPKDEERHHQDKDDGDNVGYEGFVSLGFFSRDSK